MPRIDLTRTERRALRRLVTAGGTCAEQQIAPEPAARLAQLGLVSVDWCLLNRRKYSLTLRGQAEVLRQRFPRRSPLARLGLPVFGTRRSPECTSG